MTESSPGQSRPGPEAERHAFFRTCDTAAAWLAAAKGAELGISETVHRDRPELDPQLPGLWRLASPF